MNTESCDMVMVSYEVADSYDMPPGGFCFRNNKEGQLVMWLCFPNGSTSVIKIRPYEGSDPSWEWDGNEDKPTLSPSVNAVGCWHGWVKSGRLVSC